MKLDISSNNRKTFLLLWFLCLLGHLSLVPFIYHLKILPPHLSLLQFLIYGTAQVGLIFALVCWVSYKILPKTDLHPFSCNNILEQIVYPAALWGLALACTLFLLDKIAFQPPPSSSLHPFYWTKLLGSLYGAINEEVLFRLFLFTLIYFLFGKIISITSASRRSLILWVTNILVSLLFGLGHLLFAANVISLNYFDVFRLLMLNGIGSIIFGWFYWTKSLWTAILAHLITLVIIHVFVNF